MTSLNCHEKRKECTIMDWNHPRFMNWIQLHLYKWNDCIALLESNYYWNQKLIFFFSKRHQTNLEVSRKVREGYLTLSPCCLWIVLESNISKWCIQAATTLPSFCISLLLIHPNYSNEVSWGDHSLSFADHQQIVQNQFYFSKQKSSSQQFKPNQKSLHRITRGRSSEY